jgi:toxin FitB
VKYLVDANVLSEPTKPRPDSLVMAWWERHRLQTALSPIVLVEVHSGILRLPKGRKRTLLEQWFEEGIKALPVLEINGQTALHWAYLMVNNIRTGRAMPFKDSLIAASAKQHDLTIVTRNISDFRYAGVRVENPIES